MKPYSERTIDTQYHDLLERIMDTGRETVPIHDQINPENIWAKMVVKHDMRFDMRNGFPLITERDMSGGMFNAALGEHMAFIHGARTQEELKDWGCGFWSRWVPKEKCEIFGLPEGDLGKGSYGVAWNAFPTAEGPVFHQVQEVVRQIIDMPNLRTHFISPWIPQHVIQHNERTRSTVVAPCHGWIHVFAFPHTKELAVHHFQRSGDCPTGLPFNIIQYAAFGMMVAHLTGYEFTEYAYTISDAHIYNNQFDSVAELLQRDPKPFPTVTLKADGVTDIMDFRPEHFVLGDDYDPHPAMKVPTPV